MEEHAGDVRAAPSGDAGSASSARDRALDRAANEGEEVHACVCVCVCGWVGGRVGRRVRAGVRMFVMCRLQATCAVGFGSDPSLDAYWRIPRPLGVPWWCTCACACARVFCKVRDRRSRNKHELTRACVGWRRG